MKDLLNELKEPATFAFKSEKYSLNFIKKLPFSMLTR